MLVPPVQGSDQFAVFDPRPVGQRQRCTRLALPNPQDTGGIIGEFVHAIIGPNDRVEQTDRARPKLVRPVGRSAADRGHHIYRGRGRLRRHRSATEKDRALAEPMVLSLGSNTAVPSAACLLSQIRIGAVPRGPPRATSIDLETCLQRRKSYQHVPGKDEKYPRLRSKCDPPDRASSSKMPPHTSPTTPLAGRRKTPRREHCERIWTRELDPGSDR